MKTILLILLAICFELVPAFGQSQSDMMKDIVKADLAVLKVEYDRGRKPVLTPVSKKWPLELTKSASGDIEKFLLKRSGIVDEPFEPDIIAHSVYFFYNGFRITLFNGLIFYYKTGEQTNFKYILSTDETALSKLKGEDLDQLAKDLNYYLSEEAKKQKEAKQDKIENIAEEQEKEKARNSIKGKTISKIEIVWKTNSFESGLQSKVEYGIRATDVNGTIYQTNTLGGKMPWDDFIITCRGAEPGDEHLVVPATCDGLTNNKLTLTVKSKHHPNLVATGQFELSFSTPVFVNYNGKNCFVSGGSERARGGQGGVNLTITVCESSDKLYHLVEIKDGLGTLLHRIKVQKGVTVGINNSGGNGCTGSSDDYPGHGGDGGNITIHKAPGTDVSFLSINNSGGRSGGLGARNGSNGTRVELIKTVNLNF